MADQPQVDPAETSAPDRNKPGAEGVNTTKLDLNRDFNINGVQYSAGKGVEVNSDHVTALKELGATSDEYDNWANTHHGAVPVANDPQEATAQTPTRPLGGEHVRVTSTTKPVVNEGDAELVRDPNEGNEKATELAKDADKVSA